MPEFPPSLIFASALNSQFPHSRTIQNKWLASPSPTMAPSFTLHDSGWAFAFQPSRVLPSNILTHPLSSADEFTPANKASINKTCERHNMVDITKKLSPNEVSLRAPVQIL